MAFGIRIIKVPEGEAPLRIRELWVGLVLACTDLIQSSTPNRSIFGVETLTQRPPVITWEVFAFDAIEALRRAEEFEAVAYWERVVEPTAQLNFHRD